jgi:uncharacterized protein (UPF0548 family)
VRVLIKATLVACREGETLGTLILNMGFYSLAACRIVYTIDEGPTAATTAANLDGSPSGEFLVDEWGVERFGFAYGTLPCHLVAGEERFQVEWDKTVRPPCASRPLAVHSAG